MFKESKKIQDRKNFCEEDRQKLIFRRYGLIYWLFFIFLTSCGSEPNSYSRTNLRPATNLPLSSPLDSTSRARLGSLSPSYECKDYLLSSETMSLCHWINYERIRIASVTLLNTERHNLVAQKHAEDMSKFQYLSHTNQIGQALDERLRLANIPFLNAEENIAFGYFTGVGAADFWMNSISSKNIILHRNFNYHGVGYHKGYWSHVFTD